MADIAPAHGGVLGLLAGGGSVPLAVAEALAAQGRPFFVVMLKGFADPALAAYPHAEVGLGRAGALMRALREAGCRDLVIIGTVKRPDFGALELDARGAMLLPRIIAALRGGDDTLLSAIKAIFEGEGFRVLGAETVAGVLAAPPGMLGRIRPDAEALADIARGIEVLRALGALDIGQAAVLCARYVLAVEAAEGTDAMLRRCAELPAAIRGTPAAPRGVLVKLAKPRQTRALDLPTLGPRTVELAAAAGLRGIAFEAGGSLLADREGMIAAADRLGLFLAGIDPAAPP